MRRCRTGAGFDRGRVVVRCETAADSALGPVRKTHEHPCQSEGRGIIVGLKGGAERVKDLAPLFGDLADVTGEAANEGRVPGENLAVTSRSVDRPKCYAT
jgi:hypothetical protein